jgi:TolB protein
MAADAQDASLDAASVVANDLARSGRFKTMDRKDMIEQPHAGAGIGFDDWRRLGNDYILVGQMQPQGPDRYNISFELYNVLNRQRLLGYQISANRAGLRLASHQVAGSPTFPCSGRCRTRATGSSSPTRTARTRTWSCNRTSR